MSFAGSSVNGRVLLRIAYRGGRYAGWQLQPNAVSVQEVVQGALSQLLEAPVRVTGASRTDAGVHALAQHAHLDLPRSFPLDGLVLGANRFLPEDVRLLAATAVGGEFHAQREARWKRYRYRLARIRVVDPLRSPYVASMDGRVRVEPMARAAEVLVGRHDFSAFARAGGSHDDPRRELYEARVMPEGEDEILFEFRGDGFLRGMVRALVGTLVEVGLGRRGRADLAKLLEGGSRGDSGVSAPAKGLVLAEIHYPPPRLGACYDGAAKGDAGEVRRPLE